MRNVGRFLGHFAFGAEGLNIKKKWKSTIERYESRDLIDDDPLKCEFSEESKAQTKACYVAVKME